MIVKCSRSSRSVRAVGPLRDYVRVILHRWVEYFLDCFVETMDFVDEENITTVETESIAAKSQHAQRWATCNAI